MNSFERVGNWVCKVQDQWTKKIESQIYILKYIVNCVHGIFKLLNVKVFIVKVVITNQLGQIANYIKTTDNSLFILFSAERLIYIYIYNK